MDSSSCKVLKFARWLRKSMKRSSEKSSSYYCMFLFLHKRGIWTSNHPAERQQISIWSKCWRQDEYRLANPSLQYFTSTEPFKEVVVRWLFTLWDRWLFSSVITTWTHYILILLTAIWTIFCYWGYHAITRRFNINSQAYRHKQRNNRLF